jgi:hypothetical protein
MDASVYFPIGEDRDQYQKERGRKVRGLRQNAIDGIDALEPYKGGRGHQLWMLNKLDNTDKHRLLLTAGSALHHVDIGPLLWAEMQKHMSSEMALQLTAGMQKQLSPTMQKLTPVEVVGSTIKLPLRPADNLCPLKVGDEVFVDIRKARRRTKALVSRST